VTKSKVEAYLQPGNKTLDHLFSKLQRLKLWNDWLQTCLPEETILLSHCQIVGLDKHSLIIIADNSHWVARFRFFIPEVLTKLKAYSDFKDLRAICCKVRPLQYSHHTKKTKRQPLLISKQTAEIMQKTANKLKHKKLKDVLDGIAKRQLEL
jgi:hypothetical protein